MGKVLDSLLYTESHEWVRIDNEYAYVGITDFSQKQLGLIKYIDSQGINEKLIIGDEFGSLESTKATSDLFIPLSGTIVDVNQEVLNSPDLINKDPYVYWILKIKLNNSLEIDQLMNSKSYADFCK